MKTLEQKAREYTSGIKDKYVTLNGLTVNDVCEWVEQTYIDATTEALRWRDVNVELPEDNQCLIRESTLTVLKGRKLGTVQTNKVLVKYRNGDIDISTRCKCNGDTYYWWSAHESFEPNNEWNIIAWRPI